MRAFIPLLLVAAALPAADLTLRYPPDGATIGTSDGIPVIADVDGNVTSVTLNVDGADVTSGAWNQARIALRTGPIVGVGSHTVTVTATVDGSPLTCSATITAVAKASWSRIPLRLMPVGADTTSVVRAIAAGYACGVSGGTHPVLWSLPADPAGLSLAATAIDLSGTYPTLVGADALAVEASGRCAGVAWHDNVGGSYTASVWRRDADGTVHDLGVLGSSLPLSSLPTRVALLADGSVGAYVISAGVRHAAVFHAVGGAPLDLHAGPVAGAWWWATNSEASAVTPEGRLIGKAWRDVWSPKALVIAVDHGSAATYDVGDAFSEMIVRGISADGRAIISSTSASDTRSYLLDASTGVASPVTGNPALARPDFVAGGYPAAARYAGDGVDSAPGEVISGVWNPLQDLVRFDQWRSICGSPGAMSDPVRSVVAVGPTTGGNGRWDATIAISYDGYVSAFTRSAQAAVLVRAQAPTVVLTAPARVAAGVAVTVTAAATDPDLNLGGGLGGFSWFVDGARVNGQNTATLTIASLSAGNHNVYAMTGNLHGIIATSATSVVQALTQPICTITAVTVTPTRGPISANIGWSEGVTGFDVGDLAIGNATVSSFSGSGDTYSVTLTPSVPSGTVTLAVSAAAVVGDITGAGNPISATTSWVVDQVPPVLAITAYPARTANTTPTISGTTEVGATLTATVDGTAVSAPVVSNDGTWTLTLAAQPDGSHVVSVVASDALGNTGAPEVATVTTDTTGPATAPTINLTLVAASHSVVASGTAPAGAVQIRLTYGGTTTTVAVVAGEWSATLAAVADGGLTVVVRGLDDLGNAGPQATANILVDTLAPTVTVVRDQSLVRGGSTASWTVTLGIEGEVAVRDLTGRLTLTCTGSVVADVPVVTTPADAAWKRTVTMTVTGSGTVALTVAAGSAVDASGNASTVASAPDATNVDGAAPVVAVTTPGQIADLGDFAIAVSANENLSVQLTAASISVTNGTLSNFASTGGNGWSATISPTGSPVSVSVAAGAVVDTAGNPSAATGPATVTVVPNAPRPTARPTITGGASCGLLLACASDPATWIVGSGLVPVLSYEWLINGAVVATGSTFRPARPTCVGAMLLCRVSAAARLPDGSTGPSASILSDPITLGASAVTVSDITISGTATVLAAVITSGETVLGNGASWHVTIAPGGSTTVTATSEGGSDAKAISLSVTESPVAAQ